MVVRKQSENPEDFFNKDFKEYQDGFEANGNIQKEEKQTKRFIIFRWELDRPGQASPTDKPTLLLAEDLHEGLRREGLCGSLRPIQGEVSCWISI